MTTNAKVCSLLLIVTFCSYFSFGQDIIYTIDRAKIKVKVLEIGTDQIHFLKYLKPNGPVNLIDKSQVFKIVYENGETTFYPTQKRMIRMKPVNLNSNIIWYHIFDIVYEDFTISFEKIIKDGKMSIQIPLGLGFGTNKFGYSTAYNRIYSGIGLNIYPTGQGHARYFLGPAIHLGHGVNFDKPYHEAPIKNNVTYSKLFINNGFIFSPIDNYSISAVFSLGIKYFDKELVGREKGFTRCGWFTIRMGYRI